MGRQSATAHIELKYMLCDEKAEPKALPLSLLEEITDGFSEEREIGRGGFAVVYKGMLDNGALVAVKRLFHPYKYEKQFHREVECLIKVKHKNVVRFIGYCADSQGIAESYNGKFVMADVQQRLLCFEFLPHGTLAKYIKDPTCGLDWRKRYEIINGICEGLHYLHQNKIVHLDLKPPNILLDDNMLPKIADFGLSRCFDDKQSHITTKGIGGTMGYLAPEFSSHKITYLFDLYSLGVIMIEILTGKKGYEPVKHVLESWSNKLEEPRKDLQLEQVRLCTEIGMECIDANPAKRPVSMQHILSRLHQTGSADCSPGSVVATSSTMQISFVSESVDEELSTAISAMSSDQLRRISAPKGPGETSTEVLESWGNRLEQSHMDIQLQQVQVCTEIGIECIESNRARRPVSTPHIIARIHETGNTEGSIETVMARSSALQAEADSDDPQAPGGTNFETSSSVSGLVDVVPSIAVSATSSVQLQRISASKGLEDTNFEDFSFSGSSIFESGQTMPEQMSEVVLLAVKKVGFILGDEAAKAIITKLSEKVTALKELPQKFEQIRKQLTIMSNVIKGIGTVYLTDEVVRSWIGEVRNVAYHVEDVMDKYSYHVLQVQEEGFLKKYFIKGTHYVKVFSEIADEVVYVEKEIQQVIQMKDYWLQPLQLVPNQLTEMKRQLAFVKIGFVKKDLVEGIEDLVGIEDNRILLTGWLHSKEPESTVIAVSGMGGLGKSTLVLNVYEREKINFPAHAWILVSQIYTVGDLLRKLLRKIGYTTEQPSAGIDKMEVHALKKEIQQRLKNKKYLIILDDVWDQEVYIQMHGAFRNLQGSRIIVTTRKNHVEGISSPTRHLELQPLSHPDAFDLFCRRAFYNQKGHMCPKEFETIATSIVERCHGLPLVIVIIGNILSSRQRLDIWEQMYNQLRRELSNNDHIREILTLSYHDLSDDLRSCLLYCSLFPEDYHMSRDSLVRLWVAEGFVLSKEKNTPEMVAEGNLMELIHRNMLVVVESDELGRVNTCKMHGIVRELAISIAKEERFGTANDDLCTMIQMDSDVRRLSTYEWTYDTALKVKLPHLRTVLFLGIISSSPYMLPSILSESNYLTVLELQDSEVTEVPTMIGHLFNLRYIGLRRTKVKSLPDSIEYLSNLHTLDIKQTKIEKLPRGIAKIKKLRHLLADRYDDEKQTEFPYCIGVQAPENLSNLKELQTLETVKSSNGLAKQLKKLMQLRSVWIENISAADCANLFATLSNMPSLSSLLLSARDENEALCFEALMPKSVDLHRLTIRGQWAEGTLHCPIFHGHGTHLKYLALSWCHLGEDPLGMLATHLPNLTYLRLANMHGARTLVIAEGSFPNLKTLVLKHMPDVRELNISDGALSCIEGLYIVSLSKLGKVPRGIEFLRSLKKLWLLDLHMNFRSRWANNLMHHKMLHVPEVRI